MAGKHHTGLLISFDGLDSTGKETQTGELVKKLRSAGQVVTQLRSPDYATPSGQELKKRLQNKIGKWEETPWQEKMAFFARNRAEHKNQVLDSLERGEIVVYDRYVGSSVAFMAVEAFPARITTEERQTVKQAVEKEEYENNGMPHEHISIFLDVPPFVSARLLAERKSRNEDHDEYTDKISVQERLYAEYEILCKQQPDRFLRIVCVEYDQFLSIESIADLVWTGLTEKFPLLDISPTA